MPLRPFALANPSREGNDNTVIYSKSRHFVVPTSECGKVAVHVIGVGVLETLHP